MAKNNNDDFDQKLIDVARVVRVTSGGKRFRFRTVMLVGDREGRVGVGHAKGSDIPKAIDKAVKQAKGNLVEIDVSENTIPTEVKGKFKSAEVIMKPARKGRGLVAGGVVRAVCDLVGFEDISAKIISRTNNKLNIAWATIEGFKKIKQLKYLKEKTATSE